MSATVEEPCRHGLAVETVAGAEADQHEAGLLRILTQGYAQLESFDLLRDVHKPFHIAFNEVELCHLFFRYRVVGGVQLLYDLHLVEYDVGAKTECVGGIIVEYPVVNLVFVDSFCQQLADDVEYLGT